MMPHYIIETKPSRAMRIAELLRDIIIGGFIIAAVLLLLDFAPQLEAALRG